MCLFRKKTKAEKNYNDRELVEKNALRADVLIAMVVDCPEAVKLLEKVKEQLKYLQPSDKKDVYDYDCKIKNMLEDGKIDFNKVEKSSGNKEEAAQAFSKKIGVLIAERNLRG